MYHAQRAAGVLALLGLAAAAWFSIRLSRADAAFRAGTPESVAHAVALIPLNTAYLSLRALQVEYSAGDPRPLFEEMARLNPMSSAPRLRLGLDAETRGDIATAERWLLDAARVDHQYEPRWTLANFYFRRERTDDFWKWLHAALEVSYGDRAAALDLAWAGAPDPRVILTRAIPDQREVLAAFLWYLRGKNLGDRAPIAIRLSQFHSADDTPLLHQELDSLLAAHQRTIEKRAAAREIWRNLGYPDPGVVFAPDFGPPHIGHGFDWKLEENTGVRFTPLDAPPALRITFNGTQPESCELLRQYVSIDAAKRYVLRWDSRGIASGLTWRIGSAVAPLARADDWNRGQLAFTATDAPLTLTYARPLGEPRVEGAVELRHVSMEEQP